MYGLKHLVEPLSVQEFVREYWGKRAVYIPGEENKFSDLFGWQEVNDCLSNSRRSYDGLRLIHETKALPSQALAKLDHWLREGATLGINNVSDIDPVVKRFSEMLGSDLNTHVNCNGYVSCPSKQGFDNHFDQHCVFAVALEGRKSWKVFEPSPGKTFPLHAQGLMDKGPPPETDPYIECEMSPGDVLYIPRGHWHYALANTPSIHLTFGPASKSGAEFLVWLANQLMTNDEFFRKDFPLVDAKALGGDSEDDSLQEHLEEFRRRVCELVEGDALQEGLVRYCMSSNPIGRKYNLPENWLLADEMTPETEFRIPIGQKTLVRYDEATKLAAVHVRGHLLYLEDIPEPLVAPMFATPGAKMSGKELLEKSPEIEWDRLKAVLLQMCDHGLIELYPSD